VKQFYVYCVYFADENGTEVPLYVGKGHDDTSTGYSRLQHYRTLNRHLISKSLFDRIAELRDRGTAWGAKKLIDADDEIHAFALERHFIAEFGRAFLVNCTDGGSSGWSLRLESRRKMSKSRLGKKLGPISDEHRQKLIVAARRRAADPVWRAAHSAKLRGKHLTPETRAKIAAALTGKSKTEAHKASISTALAGLPHSAEHNINSGLARLGKKRGSYKTRSGTFLPEEKHQHRLETYRRSYEKRSPEILAALQIERDAERLIEWQALLRAKGLPLDTPLPIKRTHLSSLSLEQRQEHKRARERINHALRKAKAAGDALEVERLQLKRKRLDDCF
jgi:hypothetical protein